MNNVYIYNENQKLINILENIDWSRKQNRFFSKNHSIASYLAMFTPSLPAYFIDKYSNENDYIMDNFSGRGTTALVCREKKRKFIGTDLNPYALVLSRYKINSFSKLQLINCLQKWEKEYESNKQKWLDLVNDFQPLLTYYSKYTLSQLLFVRYTYAKNWENLTDEENAIVAFMLGLMHGKQGIKKQTYFSISMSNTISMSIEYVKKYAKVHNLTPPEVNIFKLTQNKINSKYEDLFSQKFDGSIFKMDATKLTNQIKDNSIQLVITSPPYLSIVDYRVSNWLKLWLLGYDKDKLKTEIILSDKLKMNEYIEFIKQYLNSIYPKLKNNAHVCLVVGDVKDKCLIEEVWSKIKNDVNYTFKEIYYDYGYKQTNKVTNALNSKKGKATLIEKVLVLIKKDN